MTFVHVVPLRDLREHDERGGDCWCEPEVCEGINEDDEPSRLVVHASADGREHREPDHDRANCPRCFWGVVPPLGSGA